MKYMPLPKFDVVDAALNFHRDGLDIEGSCDIFTVKPTRADKQLKKRIDGQIAHQHQQNLQLAASLSPPEAARYASSPNVNLTQASTFGNLTQPSNRRTYAYLIGTLNASHPDYDLSNVLRPHDFCRERDVQEVINEIDAKVLGQDNYHWRTGVVSSRIKTQWGYDKWQMIDEEMNLGECEVYNFCPSENPFDGDGMPLWSLHYFFFNRAKKRVCYLQVRAIDPSYQYEDDEEADYGLYDMSEEDDTMTELEGPISKRKATRSMDLGAEKRAKYWLGDRYGKVGYSRGSASEDDRAQVDIDSIKALVEYRKKHPEEFPVDVSDDEDASRRASTSPTPASTSGNESDGPSEKKTQRSIFAKKRRESDVRAMSADPASGAER